MKPGDLVRTVSNAGATWVGVVLEVRTSPSMIRVFFSQNPKLSKHFSNAKFFEVIREAECKSVI